MEKKVKISMLCQIYGKLLTEKQLEILSDYYNNDLSLSEIAENNHIKLISLLTMIDNDVKKCWIENYRKI